MGALSDSFLLATLPRIADLPLQEKAVIATPKSAYTDVLDIGISKSSICSYILKPTPKLVWSYSLSPSTLVNCIEVAETPSKKQYVIGLTDRKVQSIMFINKSGEKIETCTIKTASKVVSAKFSADLQHVYCILEDSTLEVYNLDLVKENMEPQAQTEAQELERQKEAQDVKENFRVSLIHSILNKLRNTNILYYEYLSKSTFGANSKDGYLLLVEQVNKKVQARFLSLDLENSLEMKLFVLKEQYTPSKFAFEPENGILYQYLINEDSLISYSLPNFIQKDIFSLALNEKSVNNNEVSILNAAPSRLLISYGNSIYLFNTKFKAILSEFHDDSDKVFLQSVASVKGNSLKTSNTFAAYLSHSEKQNDTQVKILSVNVGFGTMYECLGKGISKKIANNDIQVESNFKGLPDLLDEEFVANSVKLEAELRQVFEALKKASLAKDLNTWERILIPFLKGESWQRISDSLSCEKSYKKKDYQYQVFEVEKDRIVDFNFIRSILLLIFQDSNGNVSLRNAEFLPEYSLTYLLTHPLYPREFTNGVLEMFEEMNNLRLLRQALITCPNLGCFEIVKQLSTSNDDIFRDTINRLNEEYSITQITETLLQILKHNANFDLQDIVKKCFILDYGWEIASALIDAGGIFGWSAGFIEKLIADVDQQLESLNGNSYNLTLTNQALLQIGDKKTLKKKSSKKTRNETDDIVELNKQEGQLKSMLTIKNTSRRNLLNDGISFSKKIPSYSIEKLVL